jgi:hypothetical protein
MKIKIGDKMKLILILIIGLLLCNSIDTYSQTSGIESGKRYLKLGNTYREAANFPKALKYLKKGFSIVSGYHDSYWMGVGSEFYGYYYRDLARITGEHKYIKMSQDYLDDAYDHFSKVIRQQDGSPRAINELKKPLCDQFHHRKGDLSNNDYGFRGNDDFDDDGDDDGDDDYSRAWSGEPNCKHDKYAKDKPNNNRPDNRKPAGSQYNGDCREVTNNIVYVSIKEALAESDKTEILSLEGQEYNTFPNEILRLDNLIELNLANIGITELPEAIGNLKYLKRLNLDGNDLSKLPPSLKNLPCLKTVFLRGNFIDCDYLLSLQRNIPGLQIITDREEDNAQP